jgi:hypothetical protein
LKDQAPVVPEFPERKSFKFVRKQSTFSDQSIEEEEEDDMRSNSVEDLKPI